MAEAKNTKRVISWAEVREHNTPANAWIVIHKKVYDISGWEAHPGGSVMYTQAGEDATDAFAVFHPSSALHLLQQFYIGDVEDSSTSKAASEPLSEDDVAQRKRVEEFIAAYRRLRVKVKAMGLYEASSIYYAWKVLSTFGICLASVAVSFFGSSTWHHVLSGCIMGLFFQQSGWLAHDYLHHQVCTTSYRDNLMGILIGNVWQGFSVQWWKNKHNTHHAVPNLHASDDESFRGDPDIDTMPLLAWSLKMASQALDSASGRFFITNQAALYFPLLMFARLSWLLQSYMYAFRGFSFGPYDELQLPWAEKAGLLAHYMWMAAVPWFTGMSIAQGLLWFIVSQASCGLLLAMVFSIGHNGMAVYDRESKPDFWKLQVTSTRNISSSWLVDWFTGGLNYQIDHHLFPRVPRHHLGKLNVLVKSLCKEFDIPYHETGFWYGLYEVVDHLAKISHEFVTEFPAM